MTTDPGASRNWKKPEGSALSTSRGNSASPLLVSELGAHSCCRPPQFVVVCYGHPRKLTLRGPIGRWQMDGRDSVPFPEQGHQEVLRGTKNLLLFSCTPRPQGGAAS